MLKNNTIRNTLHPSTTIDLYCTRSISHPSPLKLQNYSRTCVGVVKTQPLIAHQMRCRTRIYFLFYSTSVFLFVGHWRYGARERAYLIAGHWRVASRAEPAYEKSTPTHHYRYREPLISGWWRSRWRVATTLRSVRAMAANPEPSACLKGTSPEWPSLPCRLSYRTQGRGLPKAGDCFVSAGTRSRSDRIFVFASL